MLRPEPLEWGKQLIIRPEINLATLGILCLLNIHESLTTALRASL